MASVFSHALVAATLSKVSSAKANFLKLCLLAIFCAVIPDADILAFKFGIPYAHPLGHRGFTHSITFALLLAIFLKIIFYWKDSLWSKKGMGIVTILFLSGISHGLLDALTTGGLGVGFFIPFDNERYFLPFRVIQVSPIGIKNFFSAWGVKVIMSEAIWIGLPCLILLVGNWIVGKLKN